MSTIKLNSKKGIFDNTGYIRRNLFDYLENLLKSDKKSADNILATIADLIRFNTVISIARAGTGHIGASLSMIETIVEIYYRSFPMSPEEKSSHRNMFILSKGHAVPSLYSLLASKGYFGIDKLDNLRRLDGLPGHSDISINGIEANTGSLGMGLSKAVGNAIAKKRMNLNGNVFVVVGDGELQEGQCWESFLSAISYQCDNLYIIVDANGIQTDKPVEKIVKYGKITEVFSDMGFFVREGDGKDIGKINEVFNSLKKLKCKPKIFIAHTCKGQGISFMENKNKKDKNYNYKWHNRAPNEHELNMALKEIFSRIKDRLFGMGFYQKLKKYDYSIPKEPLQTNIKGDSLIKGFSDGLISVASKNKKMVVFDGDLEEDCGLINFHRLFPDQFFEMGIMEQHMVTTASAFNKLGLVSVIPTYAAFLTARANDQIYNLASEKGKTLLVGVMSGIIPSTPGKSHQSYRDISLLKSIPGISMYQPVNSEDTRQAVTRYFNGELGDILYMRLSLAASSEPLPTPPKTLMPGMPHLICNGNKALIIAIGPVMLGEAYKTTKELRKKGIKVELWNYPWLTKFDKKELLSAACRKVPLIILEDHARKGGFGESLLAFMNINKIYFNNIIHLCIDDFPPCGFRSEVLSKCGLDSNYLLNKIINI